MYNTFQIDIDEDLTQNKSSVKSHLNERTDNKFMAGTITKNFFASNFDDEDSEYTGKTSPSRQGVEKREAEEGGSEARGRRQKKHASKLTPISQSKQVEVFQNYQRSSRNDEMVDLDLMGSEDVPPPESELKKRSPRRRAKKEEEPEHAATEKKEERAMEERAMEESAVEESAVEESAVEESAVEEVKLPSKASKATEIFFDEDIEEQPAKEEALGAVSIPQARANNQFVESDEEPIVVTTQQVENIVTGSEYFNFSNEVSLVKQLFAEVREKTTLRMEIIRDKDGFNTFWPEFHLHFSEDSMHVMSAKKTSSRPTSTFILSRSRSNFEEEGPQYLGKMKSNMLGDVLNIFGPGPNPSNARERKVQPRELLATVVFMTSLFQMGKPRQFRLFVKRAEYGYYSHFPQVRLYEEEVPLSVLAELPEHRDKIRVLHNRQPVWMKEAGGYMLNFRGRVERPSIKNFILEETPAGPDVLLFGKVNDNKFTFDVSSRISAFVGFAAALSSFDSRLMCE